MSDGDNGDAEPGPESGGRLSAEGDFMLIWGLACGIVTGLYAIDGTLATVLLLGSIATAASLGAVLADLSRPGFRPSTGLHSVVVLSAAAGALLAYIYDGALLTATGLGVVALANAGRVYEVGHRDADSLLDPLTEDDSGSDGESEPTEEDPN